MTALKQDTSGQSQELAKPAKELKTDFPLSEKDEVKKAEQKTTKAVKK